MAQRRAPATTQVQQKGGSERSHESENLASRDGVGSCCRIVRKHDPGYGTAIHFADRWSDESKRRPRLQENFSLGESISQIWVDPVGRIYAGSGSSTIRSARRTTNI